MENMNKDNINNDFVINEMLKSIHYMIEKAVQNTTKIYEGIVVSQSEGGRWNVKYNGETHSINSYGNMTIQTGKVVKIIVPQGNQNLAFFI